jgi:4'-phosphopantetheinyl transferase
MTHPHVDIRAGLPTGEIHVWTARLVDDDRATAGLLPILDQEERARAAKFSFERDRTRFIQTHGIVRRIMASYGDADAAALIFARNSFGKPYLLSWANGPNLQFSVSHSGDYCLLAVRRDHPVGVDIEKVRDLPQAIDVAQSYFTPRENRALAAMRGTARQEAFFVLWTHKEATIKGLGIGLAANLGRAEFDFDAAGGLRFVGWDGNQSAAQSWSIVRLDPAPGYIAAVASAHPIRSLTLQSWCRGGAV